MPHGFWVKMGLTRDHVIVLIMQAHRISEPCFPSVVLAVDAKFFHFFASFTQNALYWSLIPMPLMNLKS
jgi:hypothetical protein